MRRLLKSALPMRCRPACFHAVLLSGSQLASQPAATPTYDTPRRHNPRFFSRIRHAPSSTQCSGSSGEAGEAVTHRVFRFFLHGLHDVRRELYILIFIYLWELVHLGRLDPLSAELFGCG